MVYGICYSPLKYKKEVEEIGFAGNSSNCKIVKIGYTNLQVVAVIMGALVEGYSTFVISYNIIQYQEAFR